MIERSQMTDEQVFKALEVLTHQVGKRLEKHGRGAFVSKHETFGIIAEEWDELTDELRTQDLTRFAEELMDVAVACVLGVASMISGGAVSSETTISGSTIDNSNMDSSNIINQDAVEELAVKARESLKERMAASNLVLPE